MPGSKAENLLRLPLRRLRFVERVLTVTQTLKLQGKAVFQFLCDSVTA